MGLCDAIHKQGSLIMCGRLVGIQLYTFTFKQHRDILTPIKYCLKYVYTDYSINKYCKYFYFSK